MAQVDQGAAKSSKTPVLLAVLALAGAGILYWQFLYSPLQEERDKLTREHKKLSGENKTLKDEDRIQSAILDCQDDLSALNRQNELMLPADPEPVAFLKVLTSMAGTAGLAQGPTKILKESVVAPPPAQPKAKAPAKGKKAEPSAEEKKKAAEAKAAAAADNASKPCWEKIPGLSADPSSKASFVRVPFEIEVRGTFYQLTRYFWMLYEHAKAGRIITIENLTLTDAVGTADGVMLTARFVAVGFREGDKAVEAKGAATEAAAPPASTTTGSAGTPGGARARVEDANAVREGSVGRVQDQPTDPTTGSPPKPVPGGAPQPVQPAPAPGGTP